MTININRWIILLVLAISLSGCKRYSEEMGITSTPSRTISGDPLLEPTIALPSPNPPVTLESTAEKAAPTEVSDSAESHGEVAIDASNAADNPDKSLEGIRCGLLLPLTALNIRPETTSLPAVVVDQGRVPPEALPALHHLLDFPGTVGLAAFEVGREEEGLYLNADVPMPLASVVKILNLVAYAQESERGNIDPSQWVEIGDLNRYYLPGVDLGAHSRGLELLEERTLISGDPPSTPMEEIPWLMIRFSSNAAADYLHMKVGQQRLEESIKELELDSQTAPCPWIGQFLVLANHERAGSNRSAVDSYVSDPDRFAADTMVLALRYGEDEAFRKAEIAWRRRQPSFDIWQLYAENLNAKASANDYAQLMSKIVTNRIGSPYVNIIVRRALEWPTDLPENETLFSSIGYKGGSLPGILTTAYYGQRLSDGRVVVVVVFFRDLSRSTYRLWTNTQAHDDFARWLLSDPDAIPYLRSLTAQ